MAVNAPYAYAYEAVAASATAQVLGGAGAVGDYLHRPIISVVTTATSTVTLLDGATSIAIVAANTAAGIYSVEFNTASANGPWKVTTGAGVTVIGVGIFSA